MRTLKELRAPDETNDESQDWRVRKPLHRGKVVTVGGETYFCFGRPARRSEEPLTADSQDLCPQKASNCG